MTDLFAVPAYGSLSLDDERALFDRDRPAWLRYVAPGAGRKLLADGANAIRSAWPRLPRDYHRAVWNALTPAERDVFREALGQPLEATT